MTTRAKVGDVVAVEWRDAWCDHDTTTPDEWRDEYRVTTFGTLARLGPIVSVVGEPGPSGEGRCTTHIPRAIVDRIVRLKGPLSSGNAKG